ncbi:Hint domain-containing protein [Lutimaribacter saemankumensis]|uniref:Hint domain-containing protein n=1 Tax=Lutimaribacter saemankumensis TaxID=490829 RepID=A0A1G8QED1_9RHOB|nr:Hint domain-containing protein [Lutimaribacter saemankumensis]SDJ02460.1 Hint domain-containing protein [Lutimaribacter saemankumensis]
MAFISEINFVGPNGVAGGEYVEIVLGPGEDPADFTLSAYADDGTLHTTSGGPTNGTGEVTLSSLSGTPDPQNPGYTVYVIPLGVRAGVSDINEASGVALTNTATSTVIDFYSADRGIAPITATEGAAAGATSINTLDNTVPGAGNSYQWNIYGTLTYDPISYGDSVLCLTGGCHVRTPKGSRRAMDLQVGDLVWTLDHGHQPIIWVGKRELSAAELARNPRHGPIRLGPSSLAEGVPRRSTMLSPQHRILIASPIAQRIYGSTEVLVAAKKLVSFDGIEQFEANAVHYVHILFERHEIIEADGALVESLLLGDEAKGTLASGDFFPALGDPLSNKARTPCRPIAERKKAKRLLERIRKSGKQLQEERSRSALRA